MRTGEATEPPKADRQEENHPGHCGLRWPQPAGRCSPHSAAGWFQHVQVPRAQAGESPGTAFSGGDSMGTSLASAGGGRCDRVRVGGRSGPVGSGRRAIHAQEWGTSKEPLRRRMCRPGGGKWEWAPAAHALNSPSASWAAPDRVGFLPCQEQCKALRGSDAGYGLHPAVTAGLPPRVSPLGQPFGYQWEVQGFQQALGRGWHQRARGRAPWNPSYTQFTLRGSQEMKEARKLPEKRCGPAGVSWDPPATRSSARIRLGAALPPRLGDSVHFCSKPFPCTRASNGSDRHCHLRFTPET